MIYIEKIHKNNFHPANCSLHPSPCRESNSNLYITNCIPSGVIKAIHERMLAISIHKRIKFVRENHVSMLKESCWSELVYCLLRNWKFSRSQNCWCNEMTTFYGYDALRFRWLFPWRLISTMMFNFTTHTRSEDFSVMRNPTRLS